MQQKGEEELGAGVVPLLPVVPVLVPLVPLVVDAPVLLVVPLASGVEDAVPSMAALHPTTVLAEVAARAPPARSISLKRFSQSMSCRDAVHVPFR